MATISTHILDTSLGTPARGIRVTLDHVSDSSLLEREEYGAGSIRRRLLASAATDADGRVKDLTGGVAIGAGVYRLCFEVGEYFTASERDSFYPEVTVVFRIGDAKQHYHVPLLVSPFGYSTYRGT